jgi:hypothetical protein
MKSEEKPIRNKMPIRSKDYDNIVSIGMNSSVLKTPEQLLYERLELLEIKAENIELKFNQLERLVISLDKGNKL